jgi:phosphomannomutase
MTANKLKSFKAYDIRGRIPDELNADLARKVGRAYAAVIKPRRVVVGHDIRLSSQELVSALIDGLNQSGVDVQFIGLCGTEQVYFGTSQLKADGGIMVTASHNPIDHNGLKLVKEQSKPISGDNGLPEIEAAVLANRFTNARVRGRVEQVDVLPAYVDHVLGYVEHTRLKPLKIVVNAGNGCAGPTLDALAARLPFHFVRVHHEPDGRFPNGIPNPLLPDNRAATADRVRAAGADLGIAWDGDFDRCFFFDETGEFVEGYYIVGLLATELLKKHPGGKIIHDPRLVWNTLELVQQAGGECVQCKSGHAFIKEKMREVDALYGGEMSAHHYFRDFTYADSGMIPWLLVTQAISHSGKTLSQLVGERVAMFPASGEINRTIEDPEAAVDGIRSRYCAGATRVDETDGISVEFESWRFNLRKSNTEPLVRLNVEARSHRALVEEKTKELLAFLDQLG